MPRGDYSAYHHQRVEQSGDQEDAEGRAAEIAREQELVQRYRSHRKYSKMHEHEARLDPLQATKVEAPRSRLEAAHLRAGWRRARSRLGVRRS